MASLRELEQRGLIEARPKSGYFVARRRSQRAGTRRPSGVAAHARGWSAPRPCSSDWPMPASTPGVARLGQALPDPALFPEAALRACLARVTRREPGAARRLSPAHGRQPRAARADRARTTRTWALALAAEELIITNGCMEALTLAVRVVASPGETIAVESPTYFGFLQIAESLGVKVHRDPLASARRHVDRGAA